MTEYLSVSALTKYIKYKFDQDPHLQSVLIKGELSNFKKHSSGHLYFNVKDKESVISAMMFKGNASKLGFEPKEGDEVLIEARVSVYERREIIKFMLIRCKSMVLVIYTKSLNN